MENTVYCKSTKIKATFIKSSSKEAACAYSPNSAEVTAAPYNAPNICSKFPTKPMLRIFTISPYHTYSIQVHCFTKLPVQLHRKY